MSVVAIGIRFFFWRIAACWWLIAYGRRIRPAWRYAGMMRNNYFSDGYSPRGAVQFDFELWARKLASERPML